MGVRDVLRRVERATRPADPVTAAALQRRWQELPASAQTPAQSVGRHAVGSRARTASFRSAT